MSTSTPTNQDIADVLDQIAELLEVKDDNIHRIRAYQQVASTIRDYPHPVSEIYRTGGSEQLQSIPGIGEVIAGIIEDFIKTGKSDMLQKIQGEVTPEQLFTQVPGIGAELSKRIVDQLDLHSLAELELAAHDGRLNDVDGFGDRRIEMVKNNLASMLSSSIHSYLDESLLQGEEKTSQKPPIGLLLEIDKEYRRKSDAGELKLIAPKRFNPENIAWLPIMRLERQGWSFTVLFSNTKRAHELEKTHDWVVVYYEKDGEEKQATIVTETSGRLKGKRVVRGREAECLEYYADRSN